MICLRSQSRSDDLGQFGLVHQHVRGEFRRDRVEAQLALGLGRLRWQLGCHAARDQVG